MKNDFIIAITQLAAEKNLSKEVVLEAVEVALASAFKKEGHGSGHNVAVKVNPTTGDLNVYTLKTVVEEVTDDKLELTVDEAHAFDPSAALEDTISIEIPVPPSAGRIAAQTAKQVVMQRLREAEREVVFTEFVGKEGDIVSGIVHRIEPKQIIMDLGKTAAVLPASEQVKTEHYRPGQRLKVYMLEVYRSGRGPQVVVSRTHRNLVKRLFELEVPEIFNGTVEIKSIAREPGYRSKVAVAARQEGVDAIGACVGLRGIRIQNIINEIHGEKIDVIEWHADPSQFVAHALSPAPVISVSVNEEDKTANVVVPDRQLSLAIGKEGQNARLAAKLTGWRIDIKSASLAEAEAVPTMPAPRETIEEASFAAPAVVEEPAVEREEQRIEPAALLAPVIEAAPVYAPEPLKPTPPVMDPVPTSTKPGAAGRIRFAEEIFGNNRGGGRSRQEREDDAPPAAKGGKKAKRTPRVYEEVDEAEEEPNLLPSG